MQSEKSSHLETFGLAICIIMPNRGDLENYLQFLNLFIYQLGIIDFNTQTTSLFKLNSFKNYLLKIMIKTY